MKSADTSRHSFRRRLFTGTSQTQESKIYCALRDVGPMSRRQIARATKLELLVVCARVNALVKKQLLEDPKHVRCPISGELVKQVRVKRGRRAI